MEPPKSEFQKKVNLKTPIAKLLPIHPIDLDLTSTNYSMLGGLHAQMYFHNQATSYPLGLHISKANKIKIVTNKVCSCLLIWNAAKKKGFKLDFYEEIPSRQIKVEVVNYSRN